jgi:hypothetical protein
MDNAEKLTRLGLQDTGRRQKQIKTKTMSNTDHKPLPLGGGGVLTQAPKKDKQFPPLIRHPSGYLYCVSNHLNMFALTFA